MKRDTILQAGIIVLFAAIFLLVGPGNFLDKRITHPYPYNILSSDAAGELAYVTALKDEGTYRIIPSYLCAGFPGCIAFLPSLSQHLLASFSIMSGLEAYQVNLFLVSLFLLAASLMAFVLISKWNQKVAYLSLPLMLFAFQPQFRVGLMWGYYDVIIAAGFVLLAAYLLPEPEKGKTWILLSVLLAASFVAHVSEILYIGVIYLFYYALKWIKAKSIGKEDILFFAKTGALTFVLIAYYAVLFFTLFPSSGIFTAKQTPQWYDPVIQNFQFLSAGNPIIKYIPLILIGIGIIIAILQLRPHSIPLMLGFAMILLGLDLRLSFLRIFQVRYLWPISLAVFSGLTLYFLLKIMKAKNMIIYGGVSALLLVAVGYATFVPSGNPGMINQNHWDAFRWISSNTEQDAEITVLHGEPYSQDALLWNTKRKVNRIPENEIIEHINRNNNTKYFFGYAPGPSDVQYAYWTGFLKAGRYAIENATQLSGQRNICLADYVIFDKAAMIPQLAEFNIFVANQLLANQSFSIAYQNDEVAIIRNMRFYPDCIEEGTING